MTKTLTLVRGLPGSGKSTFAKHISEDSFIFEADKYFYDKDGNYKFDASSLKEAHEWCRNQVEIRMIDNRFNKDIYYNLVVSNTFTQEWEMENYLDLATTYGYRVFTVIVENRHGSENIHGVPTETMDKMRSRFNVKL